MRSDSKVADRHSRGHERPCGVSDATVAAAGKVTEALEWVERARGHLYEFHQLMGHADQTLVQAVKDLHEAGHSDAAERLRHSVVGLDVLQDRWTFEIVEEFDDGYYTTLKDAERQVRRNLLDGRRHVFEAEMKAAEQHDEGY